MAGPEPDSTDLATVISAFTRLDAAGGHNLKGACPFRDDGGSDFHVNPVKQLWHCFGCQLGGDVAAFLRLIRDE